MNVRDTSPQVDTPMCQIWKANVKLQKKLWAGHESAQADGQTDKRTDRVISINFVYGGININI